MESNYKLLSFFGKNKLKYISMFGSAKWFKILNLSTGIEYELEFYQKNKITGFFLLKRINNKYQIIKFVEWKNGKI